MSTAHPAPAPEQRTRNPRPHPDLALRAWICLAATVLSLPAGIGLAGAIVDWLGYSLDQPDVAPTWVVSVAGLSALVVILVPAMLAFVLGRRAVRSGDDRGRLPMLLAGIGGALFAGVNLLQLLLRILGA